MKPLILLLSVSLLGCSSPKPSGNADIPSTPVEPSSEQDLQDCSEMDFVFFEEKASPILSSQCFGCHNANSVAANTRHVLLPFNSPENIQINFDHLRTLATETDDGADLLLEKPTNQTSHAGGQVIDMLEAEYAILHEMVARFTDPGHCENPGEPVLTCEDGGFYPGSSPYRRLTKVQYLNSVKDLLDVVVPDGLFPETSQSEDFRTWNSNNVVSAGGAEGIMLAAEFIGQHVNMDRLLDCTSAESEIECGERVLNELAERAYRRPLTIQESQIITTFLTSGLELNSAVQMGIEIIFNSPQFLYIDASGGGLITEGSNIEHLDQYAIASRLSYFFLNTTPDEVLLNAAANGTLGTRMEVREHANRMANDPRFLTTLTGFHDDWLDLYTLGTASRDESLYPTFTEDLLTSMQTENDLFISEVIWSGSLKFEDLFFSQTTWVNSELAEIYGMSDPGPGWHRVELDESRPGILTRGAFLTSHAYRGASAPIKRGAFVLKDMLCEELAAPPDVNTVLPEETAEINNIRDRLAAHQTDSSCISCHEKIDPIGFAFENYDAIGVWRTEWENGVPIDATGDLDMGSFDNAAELIAMLATTDTAKECYTKRWFEYAMGRPAESEDLCTLDQLSRRFINTDGNIRNLVVDLAMTDAFLYRFAQETEQ